MEIQTLIAFGMHLTGHDEATIRQMLNDWMASHSSASVRLCEKAQATSLRQRGMDLHKAIKSIDETTYYNIHDLEKKPIKVIALGFSGGRTPGATCKREDGEVFHIPIIHLAVLSVG